MGTIMTSHVGQLVKTHGLTSNKGMIGLVRQVNEHEKTYSHNEMLQLSPT